MSKFTFDIYLDRERCLLPVNIVCRRRIKRIKEPTEEWLMSIEANSYEDCIDKLKAMIREIKQ